MQVNFSSETLVSSTLPACERRSSSQNMSSFQIFLFACLLLYSLIFTNSQLPGRANVPASWNNTVSADSTLHYTDGSILTFILLSQGHAFGFYCNRNSETYILAVFILDLFVDSSPQAVWSANPNNPVQMNSTLQFTHDGDLVLKDVDGTWVWSTNTTGRSVAGLNLTEMGNLVLFDHNGVVVWQSFDHPTDCLVPGQILKVGQKLTASVSSSNSTQGGIHLSVTNGGLIASIESNPPQVYFTSFNRYSNEVSYVSLTNGSLAAFYTNSTTSVTSLVDKIDIPHTDSAPYMKLGYDGHLKVFVWQQGRTQVADITERDLGECGYPMVCGENGICTNGQCSCPTSTENYFKQIDGRQPNLGCSQVTPLTCNATNDQKFLDLDQATYFTFVTDIFETSIEKCKEACLKNCLCKAAIFRYEYNASNGNCYLPTQIFSLTNDNQRGGYFYTVSIKVQVSRRNISPSIALPPIPSPKGERSRLAPILGSAIGTSVLAVGIGISVFIVRKKRKALRDEVEEDYLDQVPGMPTRFSFEELKNATENFNRKLGEGGFGSVFQGSLPDGNEIAVKFLDGVGQVKKSFLAEVETIGSIHHFNLVRLIGFCADKSHRLLVYEYMKNGSLEKWIYAATNASNPLDWKCRKRIILDIAKGLSYLHQDCRQKIVHMDIKPQNILLDEHFNAKLSDFGLSKLIDRNKSLVVTRMRGTPGYLAPEWISSVITEKVDVYSFGIVLLEILCGRRNYEKKETEEERHLLSVFKMKAEMGQWLDMIDKQSEDMQSHGAEVVEMMQVAVWCLQGCYAKRPSMSTVINVLEGVKDVKRDLGYDFSSPQIVINGVPVPVDSRDATPLPTSTLSGPR